EAKAVDRWYDTFREVVVVLCTLHLIKYPLGAIRFDFSSRFGFDVPSFGGLDSFQVDRLEDVIGMETFALISRLGETDPHANEVMEWVRSLPELTEEDWRVERLNFHKQRLEDQGIEGWQRMPAELRAGLDPEDVEMLLQWAREHGFDESKLRRMGVQVEDT
ncbi:MAG TPA: hypothetical protein VFJ16_17535, partial [Longimicrobium sp.]|nr:hypothetical protein [Longimicrobium sp.]